MGFLLLLPFFLVRFGLLSLLNRAAVQRAAYFAPMSAGERPAYLVYQLSNAAILLYPLFLSIRHTPTWVFAVGLGTYSAGLILLILSTIHFAAPSESGINQNGLYRFSRNPMYVSYFIFFVGCALLTQSALLLFFVLVFQVSAHWIILAEERWCLQTFGEEYRRYMTEVRRYL